jgi:hypothetical protein
MVFVHLGLVALFPEPRGRQNASAGEQPSPVAEDPPHPERVFDGSPNRGREPSALRTRRLRADARRW